MIVSKIPGLGDYGHYVDGINFDTITEQEWLEIGKLNLKGLVTVLRDISMHKDEFRGWVKKFGPVRIKAVGNIFERNGVKTHRQLLKKYLRGELNADDAEQVSLRLSVTDKTKTGDLYKVIPHGDLYWHANEAACINFVPNVALLGWQNMTESATGFTHTVHYYESLTESTRSEFDEMVLEFKHDGGKMTPVYAEDNVLGRRNKLIFCPEDGMQVPFVLQSPGGIKGLHYPKHEVWKIKGLTEQQSQVIFDDLHRAIFDEKFQYMHHYNENPSLILFDNSVTLHCRQGARPDRVAYRLQFDYQNPLLGCQLPYQPYFNPVMQTLYNQEMEKVVYE